MNSNKLFNKNYAIENVKKSKGILLIMLIVVPIVTLFCLYNYNNSLYNNPNDISVLIMTNLIGMFIIPFIVSNVLLGYVYKRNSVDFINSMPITRKKIYLSNIITGILYVILLQIINFIILAIYLTMAKNSMIPMEMLVDTSILMTVAYCFMFVLSSLALTISGNKFIQVVIVMLILFLIPFIRVFNLEEVFNYRTINFGDYNGYENDFEFVKNTIFSLPINIIYTLIAGEDLFNIVSIGFTLLLGVIYIFLGTKLFEKRKMENIGNSFESTKVHLFVKALTLYPMITLLKITSNSLEVPEIALIIGLIFVYYFVYDLITNKKVKLKATIISFITSSAVLFVVISAIISINKNIMIIPVAYKKEDIKEASLELDSLFYSPNSDASASLLINDKEITDLILNNWNQRNIDKFKDRPVTLYLKMKDNKKISADIFLDKETYNKVLEYLLQNKEYIKQMADNYRSENYMVIVNTSLRAGNINLKRYKSLKDIINNNIEKYLTSELESEINGNNHNYYYSRNYIVTHTYKNHKNMSIRMDFDTLPEVEKEVLKVLNERCEEKVENTLKNENKFEYVVSCNFTKKTNNDEVTKSSNLSREETNKLFEFIKANYNKEIDPQKDYYEIECYNYDFLFYTNNIEELEEIIKNYQIIQDDIYLDDEVTSEYVYKEEAEVTGELNI